jgi:ABC-type multidrug transport system fused ATPase/permease subunit
MTDAIIKPSEAAKVEIPREFSSKETRALLYRAFTYMRPLKWRYLVSLLLTVGSTLPILYTPWPLKVLLDHVVTKQPLDDAAILKFPPYFQPLLRMIENAPPAEIAFWVVMVGAFTVITFGVFGRAPGSSATNAAQDTTGGAMGQGQDTASRTENLANASGSYASGIFGIVEYRWHLRLSQSLNHYYRSQLLAKIKALPMTTLEDRKIGDAIYRVMYDTPMITNVLYELVNTNVRSAINFVAMAYVLTYSFGNAPEVVWLALLTAPVVFLVTIPLNAYSRKRSLASRMAGSQTTTSIEEGMSNVLAVQSLGGWERERSRFDAASRESFKRYRRLALAGILSIFLTGGLAPQVTTSIVFLIVSAHVISGDFTLGDYTVVLYYFGAMAYAAGGVGGVWTRQQDNAGGLKRVFDVLDLPAEQDLGTKVLPRITEGVSIENVTLVYPDGRQALHGATLTAPVGQIVAIVGPTGAGKTSLAYLVPRFHTPTTGRVTIDGHDLNEVTLDSLRSQVAYVFQETHLFADTILNNIRYAKPEASMAEVERVAKIAGAHDFITKLPEGYDTDLGSRGGKLSVGQKQRISIARGLLRESRILILDEPTSALDPETERYLVAALHEAAKDRAVIIIAHRLSTIAHADKIVFLEDGKVIEQGTHDELMATPGSAYAAFARLQSA